MDFESFKKQYHYDLATQSLKQYLDIKYKHLDCLLLFRIGDFYELFFEDAIFASIVLDITLTKRGKNGGETIPMCGVPYHAIENYLNKLVQEGCKIAICEQLETVEEAKKRAGFKAVVARDVVRIITPGTIIEESLIAPNLPNYLASIVLNKNSASICYTDLGTMELGIIEVPILQLINQLALLSPKEILLTKNMQGNELTLNISSQLNIPITYQIDSFFTASECEKNILAFYKIASVKAIGELSALQISSLGSVLKYIHITQKHNAAKLSFPKIIAYQNYMMIDASTRRNLEVTQSLSGSKKGSLLSAIDYTITKIGSRLLYKFLCNPLLNINEINERLTFTEFFYTHFGLTENIRKLLAKTNDLERILARLYTDRSSARDLLNIKYSLKAAASIKALFVDKFGLGIKEEFVEVMQILSGDYEIINLIEDSIKEDAPNVLSAGGFIKVDYHPRVKELYDLINKGKARIEILKTNYQDETGIETLKILHNNMLGLYIEITAKNASKMMDEKFIHRQTTANNARYTTKELQKLESEMINAKSLVVSLEQELYKQIVQQVLDKNLTLTPLAGALGKIDVFCSFAYVAKEYHYCRPTLTNDICFELLNARHPVIERNNNQNFVENDCKLSLDERIWLITGPNMSGKSTFLRQNALIAILAQIGSFIPASFAAIGIVDKIFSRIGAGDDLRNGSSTFMVEMLEVSAIIAQSTAKSLVILDEVGSGTSTYDGVSIAFAVLEHIHNELKCRCLFATHYFELTILSKFLTALKNYNVVIKEVNNKILFLHKIIPGFTDKSYGIHVATLAGLPESVINRANQILIKLEAGGDNRGKIDSLDF